MKLLTFFTIMGVILGCLLTLVISSESRNWTFNKSKFSNKPPAEVTTIEWNELKLRNLKSEDIRIRGRIWADGYGVIHAVDHPLDTWLNGMSPSTSKAPQIAITDEAFFTQQWWVKLSNGATCEITGRVSHHPSQLTHEIAGMKKVYQVKVISGIPVDITKIEHQAERLHGVVIRVKGIVGNHPTLNSLFLYPDEAAWKARDISGALAVDRFFASVESGVFDPLSAAGTPVVIDALYHRPFRDDATAPIGRLTFLHYLKLAEP